MYQFLCSAEERTQLHSIIRKGKEGARVIGRARILIKLDDNIPDHTIASDVLVSKKTVGRIRKRYVEGGLSRALYDLPRPGQPPKLDDTGEAYLVALATSDAPDGYDRWTLKLLQARMVKDKKVDRISDVCILEYLTKRNLKPWREKNVVHPHTHTTVH